MLFHLRPTLFSGCILPLRTHIKENTRTHVRTRGKHVFPLGSPAATNRPIASKSGWTSASDWRTANLSFFMILFTSLWEKLNVFLFRIFLKGKPLGQRFLGPPRVGRGFRAFSEKLLTVWTVTSVLSANVRLGNVAGAEPLIQNFRRLSSSKSQIIWAPCSTA